MTKRQKGRLIAFLIILAVLVFLWFRTLHYQSPPERGSSESTSGEVQTGTSQGSSTGAGHVVKGSVPAPASSGSAQVAQGTNSAPASSGFGQITEQSIPPSGPSVSGQTGQTGQAGQVGQAGQGKMSAAGASSSAQVGQGTNSASASSGFGQITEQSIPPSGPSVSGQTGQTVQAGQTGQTGQGTMPAAGASSSAQVGQGTNSASASSGSGSSRVVQGTVSNPTSKLQVAGKTEPLPPPPPFPEVPSESTEQQRKEVFKLHQSVDHIVTAKEPFEVEGKKMTIDEIKKQLGQAPKSGETLPGGSEAPQKASRYLKRPFPKKVEPGYFGVRQVHPGENIWNIDYEILRDYFLRRHVELRATADEPDLSGHSSGIGRLLKFLEGVVYVYDFKTNRLVKDLDVVEPDSIIIFFKISDLFAALDRIQPEDLASIHLVRREVILEEGSQSKSLMYQEDFK